jgi:AcrR family transcriptional regulator
LHDHWRAAAKVAMMEQVADGTTQPGRPSARSDAARRGPGRPRSVAADQAILAATLALLADGGYDALTMERVAARAGVGKATVYRRWGSKVELAVDALKASIAEFDVHATGSLEDDLTAYVSGMITWLRESTGRVMAGLSAEIQHNHELAEALRSNLIAPRRAAMAAALQHAEARGDIRPGVDLEMVLDILVGPLFLRLLVSGVPIEPSAAHKVVDIALRGITPSKD